MKRLLSILLPLTLSLSLATARDKAPDGLYDGYTGFAIAATPVLPAKETHPSMWFKSSDLPALRASLTTDEFAKTRWTALQKLADLKKPLPAAPTAKDKAEVIHKYYGAMSIAARAHALVSLLVTDPALQTAHRERARELLLRAYDGPIFEMDSKVKGSAVDEIYRGSWLQNYAHAYDCIQPSLTPGADRQIRDRLALEAECVYQNLYEWTDTSPHNHLSKPAWGLGSIALALPAHPHAKLWLGRAIEAANKNTRYFFSGDGIYREGSHYLIFSLTNFVPFLYHYRNVSGVDEFPVFQPVFENMVQMRNSHGWLPNIEDSYIRPTPTHLVAGAYRSAKTSLHTTAPLSEVLTWAYRTTNLKAFDEERGDSGFNYTGASWDYPLEIDELLTHDASLRATAPDAKPNVFLAGGQTILRNRWTDDNHGQRYLLFHGVAVADNHNHDDQLSFLIEAEGQMMMSDAGYSRGTYTGAERTNWYVTAAAHNTLTIDGKPADKNATNATPPVTFRVEQAGMVGEEKKAFFGKDTAWTRAIFWIAGDYYAVIDRLTSKQKPGTVTAYLHGGRGTLVSASNLHTWNYAADRYGPAAQLLTWIVAPEAAIQTKSGELTYIKGDYAEFPYLEITSSKFSTPWVTILKPAPAGTTPGFQVENRSTADVSITVITAEKETTVIAARAKAGTSIKIDDLETDASLVIVRRNARGEVLNHFAPDATYVRIAGKTL